jgi:hypothetical protein
MQSIKIGRPGETSALLSKEENREENREENKYEHSSMNVIKMHHFIYGFNQSFLLALKSYLKLTFQMDTHSIVSIFQYVQIP